MTRKARGLEGGEGGRLKSQEREEAGVFQFSKRRGAARWLAMYAGTHDGCHGCPCFPLLLIGCRKREHDLGLARVRPVSSPPWFAPKINYSSLDSRSEQQVNRIPRPGSLPAARPARAAEPPQGAGTGVGLGWTVNMCSGCSTFPCQ